MYRCLFLSCADYFALVALQIETLKKQNARSISAERLTIPKYREESIEGVQSREDFLIPI
jgi:hypothetical protein